MSTVFMPAEFAETPIGDSSKKTLFPAGPWQGAIDRVTSRAVPTTADGRPFAGYTSPDGEVLTIQIGTNVPLDGQDNVGESKFFVDIPVLDNDLSVLSVDVSERDAPHWQLIRGARRLMNLAIALGVAEMVDGGWTYDESFLESLRNGSFDGNDVGFEVLHRKTKSTKTPVVADLYKFFQPDV